MPGTLVLNAKLNGADLSTVFTDSSVPPHLLVDDGSQISTTRAKFGGSSALGGGILINPIDASLQLPGDCSGGCWYYVESFTALSSLVFIFLGSDTISPPNPEKFAVGVDNSVGISATSKLVIQVGDTSTPHLFNDTAVGADGVWHYLEWWRASGQFYVSVDGAVTGFPWGNAGTLSNPTSDIGGICYSFGGVVYFDDVWVVKGEAVHTAAFTPPIAEFVYPLAAPPVEPPPTLPPFVSPTMTTYINRLSCTVGNAPGASGDIITVGAAALGRRTFGPEHDGAVVDATITDGADWEVRLGCVYTHATATLTRGVLDDSSTGAAIDLSPSAVITVSPHARWASLISNAATRVPLPSSDPAVNYVNIMAAIADAGTGGRVVFPAGRTYLLGRDIIPLSGQTLQFGQSKLKLPDQVSTTLTAGVGVTTVATPNPTAVFNVASSTGFYVGQAVGLEDRTVGGQRTYSAVRGAVTAVAAGSVSVQFAAVASSNLVVTTNTTTFIESTATSYTFSTGTFLCSIGPLVSTAVQHSRIKLVDLEIDGNRANNPYGQRWELAPMIDVRSGKSQVDGLYVYDAPTDAFYFAALGSTAQNVWIDRSNGM